VLENKSRDPVRPCNLVTWGASEGLLHDGWCDAPGDHRYRGGKCKENMAQPGKRSSWGGMGSEDKATVSISAILAITFVGEVMRRLVVSSLMMERSVGREGEPLSPSADRRLYLRAIIVFFYKHAEQSLAFFSRRRFRAWRIRSIVFLRRCLKQTWILS
jgi:hypothetical protein